MSSNISITRICEHCSKEFTAKTTVTRFCGDDCAKRNYKLRRRNTKHEKMKIKILASDKETQSIKDKPKTDLLNKELLTAKDAAFILGCSTKAVHLMIRSGRLKAINLGLRKTRVSRSVILALFDLPELAVRAVKKIESTEEQLSKTNCYTVEEITSAFGVSRDSVYSMVNRKRNPKFQEGKEIYISKRHIEKAYRLAKGGGK